MSIKKTAHINLFGTGGETLEWVQFWLETYAKSEIKERIENGLDRLGYYADALAEGAYGDAEITVSHDVEGNKLTITAEGPEVVFWEFGTGTYADPAQELADKTAALGFDVYPGSWSEGPEGKLKYYMIKYGGMDPDEWPYTKVPRRGILAAYNGIKQQYETQLRGAFKE